MLINFNDILYIKASETDSRDKLVYLVNDKKTTFKNISFEQISFILPNTQFCRINKKEIISLKTVVHFTADEITTSISFKNEIPLKFQLSEVFKEDFRLKLKI